MLPRVRRSVPYCKRRARTGARSEDHRARGRPPGGARRPRKRRNEPARRVRAGSSPRGRARAVGGAGGGDEADHDRGGAAGAPRATPGDAEWVRTGGSRARRQVAPRQRSWASLWVRLAASRDRLRSALMGVYTRQTNPYVEIVGVVAAVLGARALLWWLDLRHGWLFPLGVQSE